jgi:hypothetical protein
MSNYALRIPNSLFDYAKQCAEDESVSMNQFFVMAIAEKVSALKTAAYFEERAGRADASRAKEILKKVRDVPALPEDEPAPAHVAREPEAKYGVRKKSAVPRSRKPRGRRAR